MSDGTSLHETTDGTGVPGTGTPTKEPFRTVATAVCRSYGRIGSQLPGGTGSCCTSSHFEAGSMAGDDRTWEISIKIAAMQIRLDVLILGGGAAGLWLMNVLRSRGYSVLVVESDACGSGQSVASQGMLHSGVKYLLNGSVPRITRDLRKAMSHWQNSLNGRGEVPLDQTLVTSKVQQLWIGPTRGDSLLAFVARNIFHTSAVPVGQADWPVILRKAGFKGQVLQIRDPVIDTQRLLNFLLNRYFQCVRTLDTATFEFHYDARGNVTQIPVHNDLVVLPEYVIITSGSGNSYFIEKLGLAMSCQIRPLKMLMLKAAPDFLFGHYIGRPTYRPQMTITTHALPDSTPLWYIGGEVAESGAIMSGEEAQALGKRMLKEFLPHLNQDSLEWAALSVDRAEAKLKSRKPPDKPVVNRRGNVFVAWPTKLTLAPLLAVRVANLIARELGGPKWADPIGNRWSELPLPTVALQPWYSASWN